MPEGACAPRMEKKPFPGKRVQRGKGTDYWRAGIGIGMEKKNLREEDGGLPNSEGERRKHSLDGGVVENKKRED